MVFPGNQLHWYWQHKITINQNTKTQRIPKTQNKQKTQPGLVACYDIWPRKGEDLFLFRRFINLSLSYLYTYPLRPTYSPGTHTDRIPFNGLFSRTTWIKKVKPIWILMKHTSTSSLNFLQAGCSFLRPTNSVRALKVTISTIPLP